MKALIIEDEPRACGQMIKLLTEHFPEVEVAGTAGSVKDSLRWLAGHPAPDVIFMDVELSDGISFDLFARTDLSCPVIMTTAYDQYAIQAFEVNAVDYLLKPVGLPELRRAVARAAAGEAVRPTAETARKIMDAVYREKFLIRLNNRIVPVRSADIAYIYSEAKNSYVVTLAGLSYVLDDSLDNLAGSLDPDRFFRISRSCIISEDVIDSVSKLMGGRLRIALKKGHVSAADLIVSRARTDAFLAWLGR